MDKKPPIIKRERAESAVPLTDCGGRTYTKDEREDIIRYLIYGAEIQQDTDVEFYQALLEEEKREIFEEIAQNCPLCSGLGEIISRKARQMGYTLADGETLDEKLIPCPLCEKVQALKSRFLKGE